MKFCCESAGMLDLGHLCSQNNMTKHHLPVFQKMIYHTQGNINIRFIPPKSAFAHWKCKSNLESQ